MPVGRCASEHVQVGGDADTVDRYCPLCAAREGVEARIVRAGVERITLVVTYERPSIGPYALQRTVADLTAGRRKAGGRGSSIEEAIVLALDELERAAT